MNPKRYSLFAIAASLTLGTSVHAAPATPASLTSPAQEKIALAASPCPSNLSFRRRFETANYNVYICPGNENNYSGYYLGIAKNGRGTITVPLASNSEETYVARNADTIYTVTPFNLLVTQNGRSLLKEKVISVNFGENDYDSFPNFCQESESMFVSAETKGFWVNICGSDEPYTYVGVSKTDGSKIRLGLTDYDQQGNSFEAVNGNVSYLLIRGTARGDFLTVTQGTRELFRQPILRWF